LPPRIAVFVSSIQRYASVLRVKLLLIGGNLRAIYDGAVAVGSFPDDVAFRA
jgi:hypothetical protein